MLYGQYALAMVFVTVASTVSAGWLGQSILRLEPELDKHLLVSNTLVALFSIGIIILGTGIVSYFLYPFATLANRLFFIGGILLVISRAAFTVTKSLFQAKLDSRRATILRITRSIGRLCFGVPLAILVFDHPAGWMIGAAVATVLSVVLIWRLNLTWPQISIDVSVIHRMVAFGFPMIGWLLGFTLLTFIDRVLLELLAGSQAVGLYTSNYEVANKALPLALAPVIQASHPIIMNKWKGNNISEIRSTITEMTRYLLIVGVPITVLIVLSSQPLSSLLLDQRYHEGHEVIPIIAVSVLLWHVAMLVHKGLEVKEKTGVMLFGVTVATIVNIGLNVITIPQYGYHGAAAATLLSFVLYFVFAVIMVERHIPWRPPVDTVRNVAVSTVIMASCVYFVYHVVDSPILGLILTTLSSGAVYLGCLFTIGEFSKQELLTIRKLVVELL